MDANRRDTLKLIGTTATVSMGAMAGCLGDDGDGGDENGDDDDNWTGDGTVPSYAHWVSWDDETDSVGPLYIDFAGLDETAALGDEDEELEEDDFEHDDPLLTAPLSMLYSGLLISSFGLMGTGLSGLLESEDEDSEFDSRIDELLVGDNVFLLLGDIDTDEIDDTLTEPPEDQGEFVFGAPEIYEQTDDIATFGVYELVDDDEDDPFEGTEQDSAIAVSDDAIVVASGDEDADAIDLLHRPIEAEAGDGERAIDAEAEFRWLLETAGHGHIAFAGYGELDENEDEEAEPTEGDDVLGAFEGADGFAIALTIAGETDWNTELAAVIDDLDDDAQSEIEDEFGASASEVDHDFEDDRLTVSASWDADPIE